ncbi:unnamed protein product [Angiostrongylus costaricensis]|uniref:Activin_recp domain-containing protein n=1 Tax=Angiostrongylus costaricensis TaxID=334426 RepID=A0A158PFR8_ANGCS|nr:unnamed protein product [Angiostrongylus costaricensis]
MVRSLPYFHLKRKITGTPSSQSYQMLLAVGTLLLTVFSPVTLTVKCLDCVGKDCMGSFCEGKDHCNGGRALQRIEVETVELLTCVCSGAHCKDDTCIGELCSYVVNHRTKEVEKGCVNASVPLVERRSMGACMIPPITGAMHHTVAKDAADLLKTESCVCGQDYCNSEKPEITVPERQKCQTFVNAKVMGTQMRSKNITCTGEFCFKARIQSKLGHMSEYSTIGCASFTGDDALAEELNPTGCAKFSNEQVEVSACFQTKDKAAIGRARANQEVRDPRRKLGAKAKSRKPPPKMEIEYEEEGEEEDEDEEAEDERKEERTGKGDRKGQEGRKEEEEREEFEEKQAPSENDDEEKELGNKDAEEKNVEEDDKKPPTEKNFIFERPTQPPIPDDSNTTMIAVFVLIILCIVVSGAVWKFELHKKLFRSSYDSVAGG